MRNRTSLILFFLFVTVFPECISGKVVAGAGRFEQYLPFIQGKRVGMVVNHTSVVGTGQTHLLDTLLKQHINVVKVFAPEHGFRGNADAGETVKDGKKAAADTVLETGCKRKDSVRKTEQLFELYKFTNVTNQTPSK